MRAPITLETLDGLFLPDLGLWLDPPRARPWAFVSHAHADHFARHERILCSEATATILQARYKMAKDRLHPEPLREIFTLGDYRLQLLPAGHIVGSAMLHVTRRSDGESLLYTGDFKVRAGCSAEEAVFRQADTLVMETTYGKPEYAFPPDTEIREAIRMFVEGAIEDGEVPVLVGYSLGKAQEAFALLHQIGIPSLLHEAVFEMTEACNAAGADLPPPARLEADVPSGHAVICPPNAVRSEAIRAIGNRRTAFLSGWALMPGSRFRHRTDEILPLSDHADYPGLLECVERVQPRRILTLHGFAREFATDLRRRGYEAWSVEGDEQIELSLGHDRGPKKRGRLPRPSSDLQELSDLCGRVGLVAARLRKVELLSAYLGGLPESKLALVAAWLGGRLLPLPHQSAHHISSAVIRRAVIQACGLTEKQYRRISAAQADSARTARILLESADPAPTAMSAVEAAHFIEGLARTSGALDKSSRLADTLRSLHPVESETLVRILTGDLRIVLKEGLVEEAVAMTFGRPAGEVRHAHMLLGDLGQTALLAKSNRLSEARLTPFTPVPCMLASPETDAEHVARRLLPDDTNVPFPGIWVEDKHDGIRAQLHKAGSEVALFSRDLHSIGSEFPELLEAASLLEADAVLDGEIIACADGRRLTFLDLQKRLGRSKGQGDLFLGEAVPVHYVIFDLLWLNGEDLLDRPLAKRRKQLEALTLPPCFRRIDVHHARNSEELERRFEEALEGGHEGLIAKDPAAPYRPGQRDGSWLRLKGAMPTLGPVS